jgi:hypothetical protein
MEKCVFVEYKNELIEGCPKKVKRTFIKTKCNVIINCFKTTRLEHLGRPLALPTNIRPGWKGLPGTNTLAYYENP